MGCDLTEVTVTGVHLPTSTQVPSSDVTHPHQTLGQAWLVRVPWSSHVAQQ